LDTSQKIVVACPNQHKLLVSRKQIGRRIVCPKCHAETAVTDEPPRQASPPPLGVTAKSHVAMAAATTAATAVAPPLPAQSLAEEKPIGSRSSPATPPAIRQRRQTSLFRAWRRLLPRQRTVQGYRAEPSWVYTTRWLAIGVAVLALFQTLPILRHIDLVQAPNWARLVALLVVMQLVAAIQLASLPDWSTTRVTMFLLAGVATLYGLVLGMLMVTPQGGTLIWDLNDVRDKAPLWCVASLLLLGLLIYATGSVAHRWRKAFLQTHVA
jgi:hypothetical protein